MKILIRASLVLTIVVLWASSGLSATTIFDNSVNDQQTRFNPGTLEVGDEIVLAGTDRFLTSFSFEYWGVNSANPDATTFAGDVKARVRFYENTGAAFNGYATPSLTPFWDSGWFGGFGPTGAAVGFRQTLNFTAGVGLDFPEGGLLIPTSDITWSVQFEGLGLTDTAGVDIYSLPVVGQDYPDYWQNNGGDGGWMLLTNSVPMNFAAKMEATVPEPSSLTLSVLGGLSILTLTRRLRRKE